MNSITAHRSPITIRQRSRQPAGQESGISEQAPRKRMQYTCDSPHRINVHCWVRNLRVACVLILLSVASSEANAFGDFLAVDRNGPDISAPETRVWDVVRSSAAPHHEIPVDTGRPPLWIDQGTIRFTFNLLLQGSLDFAPSRSDANAMNLEHRPPVVPVSFPPSSGVLFVTTLVGMLGVVRWGDSHIKKAQGNELEPNRPCSTPLVVVLSPDAVVAGNLEGHLHRAGCAVRTATTVNEIFALTDPASLSLVLVDHRIQDWDMLRTDPSLRHVLLMAVVPLGCFYTEDHCLSDLERGMDGVHDLRDGHRLLVAKVRAYLRRAGCDTVRRSVYQVGAVELDGDAHEVKLAGRQMKLSAKPFAILMTLMREPSKVFSRSELVDLVWGRGFAVSEHTLDVHICAIRQQLDREPNCRCELVTIKCVGLKLQPISSAGSIRARRLHPTPSSIFGSHTRSRRTQRFTSSQIRHASHR
ncbi:MAG: response regulator transcription factor [Nitrospira sp.]|nr:response regulator transcription factor [Nitrospira sp.]